MVHVEAQQAPQLLSMRHQQPCTCTLFRHRSIRLVPFNSLRNRTVARAVHSAGDSSERAASTAAAADLPLGATEFAEARQKSEAEAGARKRYKHRWWDDEDDRELCRTSSVRKQLAANDPSLNQSLISSGSSISQLFDQDSWERHRSIRRYLTNVASIYESTVFRRIHKPCAVITALAAALVAYNLWAPAAWVRLVLAPTAHTLLGSAISLVLVFRTNASYARFQEGRRLWGAVVKRCRDGIRLALAYMPDATAQQMAAYIQAFPWALKAAMRSGRTRDDPTDPTACKDDPGPPIRGLLPPEEAAAVLAAANLPFGVALRMTCLVAAVPRNQLPESIRLQLDGVIDGLGEAAGGCERLLSTPVPLSYTRHTSRCMMLWLLTLPAALWPSMGPATVPAVAVITYILIGIDELGVQIEEPFSILPLAPLCLAIQSDAVAAIETAAQMKHAARSPMA